MFFESVLVRKQWIGMVQKKIKSMFERQLLLIL